MSIYIFQLKSYNKTIGCRCSVFQFRSRLALEYIGFHPKNIWEVILMETNESRIRYLEAIQRVIDRLSNTSFILKGWAVSLVAGLMALAANGSNGDYVLIAYIPIAVFWFLDAYFLMMERQYRDLFRKNMDLSQELQYFTISRKKGNIGLYGAALFSPTMLLTYIPLIAATLYVMFVVGG